MVQVDVFWAYGFGASLAAAAGPKLAQESQPMKSKYFVATLLFLCLSWAPTGMLLLLRHPSWETMQVAADFLSIPHFLTVGFGLTNITQGILGFWIGYVLLKEKRQHWVHLNWIFAYFGMFFILVYGWDGLGYDRFLYDRDLFAGSPAWVPGYVSQVGFVNAFTTFLGSSVAQTLYLDGVWLLPPFFYLMIKWTGRPALQVIFGYLGAVFGIGLGGAIVAAYIVNHSSYFVGVPVVCLLTWFSFRQLYPKQVAY